MEAGIPEVEHAPVGEVEIAFDVHGEPDAPVLLVVPGLGTQMIFGIFPAWLLTECGFRVVRIDNRRQRRLDDPQRSREARIRPHDDGNPTRAETLSDMAGDAVGVWTTTGSRAPT